MHRSCYEMQKRTATSLSRDVAGIAALAVVLSLAIGLWHPKGTLAADSAPDWLRAAAQDNLPEYPKDTVAVVLLDEQFTTVKDNGEIETRYRSAYKLLRPEARDSHGGVAVDFDAETK